MAIGGERAQPTMPVIGYSTPECLRSTRIHCAHFSLGFEESGFVEGENVAIDYRWGENQTARLPALAANLCATRQRDCHEQQSRSDRYREGDRDNPYDLIVADDLVKLGRVTSLARRAEKQRGTIFS